MYHYVYRLEHIETGEFYIGSRSSKVHPTLDGYMGSMYVWKPDRTKLRKEILKDDFSSREEALLYETKKILENIKNVLNRNYCIPPKKYYTLGAVAVKDRDGNCFLVKMDDERYLSGELVGVTKGIVTVRDKNGNICNVSINDEKYISGEYVPIATGKVTVKDGKGKTYSVSVEDPRYISGELVPIMKGRMQVKDKEGNVYQVNINDPRLLTGELVNVWKGRHHSEYTKEKMRNHKGKQSGEKNSQYGKIWIHNKELKRNMKIKVNDTIPEGWQKGRIMKF